MWKSMAGEKPVFGRWLLKVLGWTACILHGVSASDSIEDMTLLAKTIFDGYSTVVTPRPHMDRPVIVKIGLGVSAIIGLDIKEQVLKIRGHIKFEWTDPRLKWSEETYGNISVLTVPQSYVWRPDMVFSSIGGDFYIGSSETQVMIFSGGKVLWHPSFYSLFSCKVNVPKYPKDVNICPIVVSPWTHYNESVKMSLYEPHTTLEEQVDNGQFYVSAMEADLEVFPYEIWFYEQTIFHIKLSRIPTHTMLTLLFPMFLSGLLGPLAFLIPPDETEKISVSVTVLLATAVFIGVIHDDLPDRSDETPTIGVYVVSLLILAFLGVLGNTVVLLVQRKDTGGAADSSPNYCLSHRLIKDSSSHSDEASPTLPAPEYSEKLSLGQMKPSLLSHERREKGTGLGSGVEIIAGSGAKTEPKKSSRAEVLNWAFFLANVFSVLVITAVMFGYILS